MIMEPNFYSKRFLVYQDNGLFKLFNSNKELIAENVTEAWANGYYCTRGDYHSLHLHAPKGGVVARHFTQCRMFKDCYMISYLQGPFDTQMIHFYRFGNTLIRSVAFNPYNRLEIGYTPEKKLRRYTAKGVQYIFGRKKRI